MKVCIDCGEPSERTRCTRCARPLERKARRKPTARTRTAAEQARRAAAVRLHRQRVGDWCPGYDVPPHAAVDLTADHVLAVAAGGDPHGPLQVLCRSCNARKGAR